MILIAHRGLIAGPDSSKENTETSILHSLSRHFHVEIDLWLIDGKWLLGHDAPTYHTSFEFISQPCIWIHAKNFEAANKLSNTNLTYFWHENDARVLTSNGYWWTFPNRELGIRSIAVMPEWYTQVEDLKSCLQWNCAGICSDYVGTM